MSTLVNASQWNSNYTSRCSFTNNNIWIDEPNQSNSMINFSILFRKRSISVQGLPFCSCTNSTWTIRPSLIVQNWTWSSQVFYTLTFPTQRRALISYSLDNVPFDWQHWKITWSLHCEVSWFNSCFDWHAEWFSLLSCFLLFFWIVSRLIIFTGVTFKFYVLSAGRDFSQGIRAENENVARRRDYKRGGLSFYAGLLQNRWDIHVTFNNL